MNDFASLVLLGWIPAVLVLFMCLPARTAVIWAFVVGWLFLPVAEVPLRGLPNLNKISVTNLAVLAGVAVFDPDRLLRFRPGWRVDLPAVLLCVVPFASSVTNGLGAYDGLSAVLERLFGWGSAYLVGRVYFTTLDDATALARSFFIGGLLYVPFCLFEIRMSPQLHRLVYGVHQHAFAQTIRFGGYRPMVFMAHGLMVGAWMSMALLIGFWLWKCGGLAQLGGWRMSLWVGLLAVTTLWCKSFGALVLLGVGLGVLFLARRRRWLVPLYVLVLVPPAYVLGRTAMGWSGEVISAYAAKISTERAASFDTRRTNEDMLVQKALQRPLFGWGRWGRNRVYDVHGKDMSITDGEWIIELGTTGAVGLAALFAFMLLPPAVLLRRLGVPGLTDPRAAGAAALAVAVVLYTIDMIPNAMVNPVFTLSVGALASVADALGGA